MLHTARYPRVSVILLWCTNALVVVASAGHSIRQLIERAEVYVRVWVTDWFYGVGSYPATTCYSLYDPFLQTSLAAGITGGSRKTKTTPSCTT